MQCSNIAVVCIRLQSGRDEFTFAACDGESNHVSLGASDLDPHGGPPPPLSCKGPKPASAPRDVPTKRFPIFCSDLASVVDDAALDSRELASKAQIFVGVSSGILGRVATRFECLPCVLNELVWAWGKRVVKLLSSPQACSPEEYVQLHACIDSIQLADSQS